MTNDKVQVNRWPKPLILLIGMIGVVIVGAIDYLTPPDLSFLVFYFFPIGFVAWYGEWWAGFVLALASAGAWIWQDALPTSHYSHPLVPYWNVFTKAAVFFVVFFLTSRLKSSFENEKRYARQDPLTGLANRRAFLEEAQREYQRARRYGTQLSLAYLDLDNFKQVNDRLGHDEGDRVLRRAAELMRQNTRGADVVSRLGGDEFAILVPEVPEKGAFDLMTKLHRALLEDMRAADLSVTFSIGLVTFPQLPRSIDAMLKESDTLMYEVKKSGKNTLKQHIYFDPQAPQG